ncbi:MAG: hypothetical protein ACXADS_11880 [Candidatus Thorarchaeota archaeon]
MDETSAAFTFGVIAFGMDGWPILVFLLTGRGFPPSIFLDTLGALVLLFHSILH